eukprot:CAMPEP_0172827182 /NCGR_PEP_ID=MMETSP1075-20121228/19942_1 /TAXON_ID=2916 /ORGANISM="Ceratium fusus, Strain PA161109" /LENGTH=70 /DNA_ID=CAMNT_0013668957 /DNA_START=17 /DNA_END=228 /DNA_ORIENTATION=-
MARLDIGDPSATNANSPRAKRATLQGSNDGVCGVIVMDLIDETSLVAAHDACFHPIGMASTASVIQACKP